MIAEHDQDRVVEESAPGKGDLEILERLVEEPHRMEVVAKRRVLERAELQDTMTRRKAIVRMMEREGDQPGRERPRQTLETRHHLLKEIAVVEAPSNLLGHFEVRLEQAGLKAVGRVHHLTIPEARLERDGGHRGVAVGGQHVRQPHVAIGWISERDRAMVQRQQRRHDGPHAAIPDDGAAAGGLGRLGAEALPLHGHADKEPIVPWY